MVNQSHYPAYYWAILHPSKILLFAFNICRRQIDTKFWSARRSFHDSFVWNVVEDFIFIFYMTEIAMSPPFHFIVFTTLKIMCPRLSNSLSWISSLDNSDDAGKLPEAGKISWICNESRKYINLYRGMSYHI